MNIKVYSIKILYLSLLAILICNTVLIAQHNHGADTLFSSVQKELRTPSSRFVIESIAACESSEGLYVTQVTSKTNYLEFTQSFSYRDETTGLKISGNKGENGNGEALSDFMIFYGKMHDFVRIALQPEYLIHEVDSVKHSTDGIRVNGKTSGYPITYFLNSDRVPLYYTFFLPDQDPITTYFESWKTTPEDIKVPDIIKIVDGEKVFTYTYTEILITPY